jgi:hypothetical protein
MSKTNRRLHDDSWQILKYSIINITFNFSRNSTTGTKAMSKFRVPNLFQEPGNGFCNFKEFKFM